MDRITEDEQHTLKYGTIIYTVSSIVWPLVILIGIHIAAVQGLLELKPWYTRPLDQRAKPGGEFGLDGKFYRGGEIMPFYVPRIEMPQIDEKDLPNLLEFLRQLPIQVQYMNLEPEAVKPHQRVDWRRVRQMTNDPAYMDKPILVSRDRYILDGNHRWWAHKELHTLVPAYVLGAEFEEAIADLFKFPKAYCYGDGIHTAITY